jgi:hypothetical protein
VFEPLDYELTWPLSTFLREIDALLAQPNRSGWSKDVELLLEEAFSGTIPLEDFTGAERNASSGAWSGSGNHGREHLRRLRAAASTWPPSAAPRPLWSERQGRGLPINPVDDGPDHQRFGFAFVNVVNDLRARGYFEHAIPSGCDDYPDWTVGDGDELLTRKVGVMGLWPLRTVEQILDSAAGADPNLMVTVVEALHDLVARPRSRDWHSFMRHHHYSSFSTATGREVYRVRINELLAHARIPLRLADSGEDVGRLIQTVADDREQLVTRVLATPGPQDAATVAHALALFRSRNASVEDKRSAIVALARVLEDRRDLLKTELFKKDEGALFHIANEFDLRHRKVGQQGDYDPVFLDWVFWWYLATVELTDRLIARQELM